VASIPIFYGDLESSLQAAMIFPCEPEKARIFAAWRIIARLRATLDGERRDLLAVALAANDFPFLYREAQKNIKDGARAGYVVALLWALIREDPRTASWDMAIEIASNYFKKHRSRSTTRALFRDCLSNFQPALHLLGAATTRQSSRQERNLENVVLLISDPQSGYSREYDLLFFAAEAKELQGDLGRWNKERLGSPSEYINNDMFELDDFWNPPARLPAWPDTGRLKGSARIEAALIDPEMKAERKRGGRPKTLSN
jgi:hypothetical protein